MVVGVVMVVVVVMVMMVVGGGCYGGVGSNCLVVVMGVVIQTS